MRHSPHDASPACNPGVPPGLQVPCRTPLEPVSESQTERSLSSNAGISTHGGVERDPAAARTAVAPVNNRAHLVVGTTFDSPLIAADGTSLGSQATFRIYAFKLPVLTDRSPTFENN